MIIIDSISCTINCMEAYKNSIIMIRYKSRIIFIYLVSLYEYVAVARQSFTVSRRRMYLPRRDSRKTSQP